ncbi:hypothetical protein D1BOALGB6SA_7252 [Olavius sp. associated proteobacterium Delta 1]|nr:hypothetical protein D1BOALGB6SA_7252 [Olavius sp. associated proteobacterium Delta 1]
MIFCVLEPPPSKRLHKIIGLQSASASVQYGIQGQPAPELNLTTWIDGDGRQMIEY